MKKLITIADWAKDSLTCQEVRSAVEGFLKNSETPTITFVSCMPSTVNTAYILSQLIETEERYGRPLETVIFQNTDPRLHSGEGLKKAEGAQPLIIRLASGVFVCGPNAGFDFSLIKEKIEETYIYQGVNEEGQFHSRDLYGRICAHLMNEMEDEMELEEVSTNIIPELRGYYIGHIDNFGNIKTTIKLEDFKGRYEYGDLVSIKMNGIVKKAMFVGNLFGGTPGELVVYPGSSGKKDNPYLEISIWRHFTEESPTTGLHTFNFPRPGQQVELLA